jgi:hypothetical protein
MRPNLWISALLVFLIAASPGFAQEDNWVTYVNREDRFSFVVPSEPAAEQIAYTSEYFSEWKANRYTVEHEGYRYVMTAVDMSTTDLSEELDQFRNIGRHGNEIRGAMAHAATSLRQTGEVTLDAYDELQVVPGHKLEIMLPDGRQNIVEIHIHMQRLYILECISPPGSVPGYDVQASLQLLDGEGGVPRYEDWSFPGPIERTGGGAGAAGELGDALTEGDTWVDYINREDRFAFVVPAEPAIEDFTYVTEYKSNLPARRYTVDHEDYRYIMTVVDMSTTDLTEDRDQFRNVGRHGNEIRGAMAFAATELRRTGEVTLDAYDELQVIPGHKLEITLPDGRQNIVEIHTHMQRLYILECISPPGAVPGYDVQASLQILDADGNVPRYADWSFPGPIARSN